MVIFMNKKRLIVLAIIIAVLIIGGIGYYFYNQFQNSNGNNTAYEAERTATNTHENRK